MLPVCLNDDEIVHFVVRFYYLNYFVFNIVGNVKKVYCIFRLFKYHLSSSYISEIILN